MASNPPPDNVFSATSLSGLISASLPPTVSPQIKTSFDAIALAAHASLLAVGFRLAGLGEDHRIEAHSDANNPQPLPQEWNANPGHYAFRYKHSQSSMEYLLQINRMGGKAVVLAMALGDDKTTTFDVPVQDFVSDGNLPATPVAERTDPTEAKRKISDIFISVGRLSDLGSLMRINVIQKLIPSLQKQGYEESRTPRAERQDPQSAGRPQRPDLDPGRDDREPARPRIPLHDPLAHPRRPMPEPMPGFEDEHEILRPPHGMGGLGGPRFGDRDLYPAGLGPNDPLRGGVGPGLGPMGGGGMHPTFDDPLFAGQGQRGGQYDPRAPPGSRYDPVGPGGRGGHPRGAGMGGRPPNPFGGFGDDDFI